MMFMDDAIKNTIKLMDAHPDTLSLRSSYNMAGMSFTPKHIADEIRKHHPDFSITYKPDFRQAIADSWPASIDDSITRKDWGLCDEFDIEKLSSTMLSKIKERLINK